MRHVVVELSFVCDRVIIVVDDSVSLLLPVHIIAFVTQAVCVLIDAFAILYTIDELSSVGATWLC